MLSLRTEEDFRKRIFVQVTHVARTIVILAIARHRRIAVDGDVVFGFALQRRAVKPLPAQARGPLHGRLQPFAKHITDNPVKPTAFHGMELMVEA